LEGLNTQFRRKKNPLPPLEVLFEGICSGDTVLLSRAITLLESTIMTDRILAQQLLEKCRLQKKIDPVCRIGITGVPGAGKSTLIESLGLIICAAQKKIAVLAIDPSSARTGGSIMGDKTRMMQLALEPNAFIRPTPGGTTLGGVARATGDAILLLESAGYDYIIVETIGVGQSEVKVHALTDIFLLLLLPNAGDDVQGIKRGIVEMADIVVVNKADGDFLVAASQAQIFYRHALHLFPTKIKNWEVPVLTCSAQNNIGVDKILETIIKFFEFKISNGILLENRKQQAEQWFLETVETALQNDFFANETIKHNFNILKTNVTQGVISPFEAAEKLMKLYKQ